MSGATRRTATVVVAALCLAVAVLALVFWLTTPSGGSSASLLSASSRSATDAARLAVGDILSYDYRHLGGDIAKAKSDTTGVFAHEYAGTAARLLREATQVKAIVHATVTSAGAVSTSGRVVVVLLFVDQDSVRQTPGQRTPSTRIDQSRVRATMTKVGDRWLVSDLAAL